MSTFHPNKKVDHDGPNNSTRAANAACTVRRHATIAPSARLIDYHIVDLISDLRHLACREGLDFDNLLEQSARHYQDEK